jgi:hypothetical protein
MNLRSARLTRAAATSVVLALGCSGGDKIVAANGSGAGAPTVITAEDSAYLAGFVANQAVVNFKNLRVMQPPNVATIAGSGASAGCNPTLTGTGDTNGNQIPEDQTISFTAQNCTVTQSGATLRLTGSVRVQDVGGLRGYRLTYSALTQTVTQADSTATISANGQVEVQWTSATAARVSNTLSTRIAVQHRSGSTSVTFTANITGTFTPSGTGQIVTGRNLPAGSFTLSGTLALLLTADGSFRTPGTPASATFNTTISTTSTMTYDGLCQADRAFASGQLRGVITGYATGALTTGFTGCGAGSTPPPGPKR